MADIAVYRPSNGTWYVRGLGERFTGVAADAVPVPGDYNGDGLADAAIFSAATATWCRHPAQGAPTCAQFGSDGDTPLAVDFNGDGRREVAVYRPSDGSWHGSGIGSTVWGVAGDLPVSAHARRPDAPVVTPAAGSYTWVQSVNATSATSGVTFRYTTDGTTPTYSSPVLPVPLTLSTSTTLRIRAFKPGWLPSATTTASYTINLAPTPTPAAVPAGGSVPPSQAIVLTAVAGASIWYTLDGTEPTTSSEPYSGPVGLPSGMPSVTLKAMAHHPGWAPSATLTATYTIQLSPAPTPAASPSSSTVTLSQPITLTGMAGAALRYTLDGTEPSPSSTPYTAPIVLPSGQPIVTLKAKAFHPNYAPSATLTEVYTIQPAPTPTASPAGGTVGPSQTIMLTGLAGAALRYTLDGTEPTGSSTVYNAPIALPSGAAAVTLKAKAFHPNYAPSATLTASYTVNLTPAPTPTAIPTGGLVNASQPIALSSMSGATIRYTVDGSEPTAASTSYAAPFTLPSDTTVVVKAKAFHPDWAPSATLTETSTIDGTAPSIVATLFPYAVNGWHNGPVTVSFTCFDTSDIATCSAPSTVTAAGSTTVTGTATDLAGNTAQTSVIVQIDGTSPTVALTSPTGEVTTTATSLELTGTVSDVGAGVAVAACNGAPVTPVGDVVACTVPLRPGRNSVVLTARDAAGNAVSAGVRVTRTGTPTALTLSPNARTLLVGEHAALSLLDDFGVHVQQAVWTTSDPAVVALSTDDPSVVMAAGAGTATITASHGGLSAAATITVVAGTTLPDGTMRWTVVPPADVSMATIFAHAIDETVPDLFAVERDWATNEYQVRAVTAAGGQRWQEAAPGIPTIADTFGGLIAVANNALVRFAGPTDAPPWRYDSPGGVYSPAQGPDGTIYAIEWVRAPRSSGSGTTYDYAAVVIDGATGRLRARVPIPRGFVDEYRCTYRRFDEPADVTAPVVGASGSGYFQIARYRRVDVRNCDSPYPDSYISRTYSSEIQLLEVTPTGEAVWRTLDTITNAWLPETGQTIPDGLGGILTTWKRRENVYDNPQINWTVTRLDDVGQRVDYTVSDEPHIQAIGDDGTAYLTMGTNTVYAVDVATWMAKWTAPPGYPIMAIAGGGVTLLDTVAGMLTVVDAMGAQRAVTPLSLARAVQARAGEWVGLTSTGTLAAVTAPFTIAAGGGAAELQLHPSFTAGGVSAQRTFAPKVPYPTIQRAAVKALQFYNPVAVRDNTEHAGSICRNPDGRYFSNIPNVSTFSDEVVPIFCTGGAQAGRYHTHGGDGGAPSSVDLANANGDLDPFTGTHRPHFVADPCGSIYRYEGPNAASMLQVLPDRTESPRACSPLE